MSDEIVGLSLSFCVRDILDGRIKEEEVTRIIASTRIQSEDAWRKVMDEYRKYYWYDDPDEGEAIAKRFWDAGKIDQPRLRGESYNRIAQGHWRINGKQTNLPY